MPWIERRTLSAFCCKCPETFFPKISKVNNPLQNSELTCNNNLRTINSTTNLTLQPFVEREFCNLFNALLKTALTCFYI